MIIKRNLDSIKRQKENQTKTFRRKEKIQLLTASTLFCLHRRGTSNTCMNIPFKLAMTTAANTDCEEK